MTKRRSSSAYADGAADIARRFGITIKALRHYEEAGLIAPVRDHHGWRSYGQAECEKLHLILLLRRFGLSLARIGDILRGGGPGIAAVIEMQERALRDEKARIDEALTLLARARARAAEGHPVDPVVLAELARSQSRRWTWSAEMNELAQTSFDAQQRRHMAETAPTLGAAWTEVLAELERIMPHASPDSADSRALGAKAAGLIAQTTGDDASFHHALMHFWQVGFARPDLTAQLPLTQAHWRFLGKAMQAHAKAKAGRS